MTETMEIPLSGGLVALVDAGDYARLAAYKWSRSQASTKAYAVRTIHKPTRKTVLMHREILGDPDGPVDHVNGNRLDNRRMNLRACSPGQNGMNRRKVAGASKYKGVSWHINRSRWQAKIKRGGEDVFLGHFENEEAAARAYDAAARRLFGEFACTNAQLGLLSPTTTDGSGG